MHELAVCQALMREISAIAKCRHARQVTDVYVGIGPLSGIEASLLDRAFPVAAAGSVASGATLHLQRTPITVRCSGCGADTAASVNRLTCGVCDDWRTQLISGDELLLERVCMLAMEETA